MIRKPNFFIVGAPKCGTTAISEYLRTHPNVFMSNPKEPHFFATDIRNSPYTKNLKQYLNLFQNATDEHYRVGEASVEYLMSDIAPKKIKALFPNAKIVVMLRNPSDIVRSFHNQLVKHGVENVTNFEKAWYLQKKRRSGFRLPKHCSAPNLLQYYKVGEIGHQLERITSIFPLEIKLHVIIFDDFLNHPRKEYQKLLKFLNLPDDNREIFEKLNESKSYRINWLGQYPKILRGYFANPLSVLKRKYDFKGTRIIKLIDKINKIDPPNRDCHDDFYYYLKEMFCNEVKIIENITGRNLKNWRNFQINEN